MVNSNDIYGSKLDPLKIFKSSNTEKIKTNIVIPTLSTDKWVSDIRSKLEYLYKYYVTSDFNQSNLFNGNIFSLRKRIQEFDSTYPNETIRSIRSDITTLFTKYFDTVDVLIDLNEDDVENIRLGIDIEVSENGKTSKLSESLNLSDYKLPE